MTCFYFCDTNIKFNSFLPSVKNFHCGISHTNDTKLDLIKNNIFEFFTKIAQKGKVPEMQNSSGFCFSFIYIWFDRA